MGEALTAAQRKAAFIEGASTLFHKHTGVFHTAELRDNLRYLAGFGLDGRAIARMFGVSEGMIVHNKRSDNPNVFFSYAIARMRADLEAERKRIDEYLKEAQDAAKALAPE